MIELNKFIEKKEQNRDIIIWDIQWYYYTLWDIFRNYEIEYWGNHLFIMWYSEWKWDIRECISSAKFLTKTTIKNNKFYTLLK